MKKRTIKQKNTNIYYGIAGINAYGVYTNYSLMKSNKKYVKLCKIKSFMDFSSARAWVENTYDQLQRFNYSDAEYYISHIDKTNWCYYRERVTYPRNEKIVPQQIHYFEKEKYEPVIDRGEAATIEPLMMKLG